MKKYLIISFDEHVDDSYIVEDLNKFIKQMYNEYTFQNAYKLFHMQHKVYEIEGTIKELN